MDLLILGAVAGVDEERRQRNQDFRLQRRNLRDMSDPFNIPPARFIEMYRFPPDFAFNLVAQIATQYDPARRLTKIPAEFRILISLRFFATGTYQRDLGQNFILPMSQTMVSRSIYKTARIIERLFLNVWVKFPQSIEEKRRAKNAFQLLCGLLHIIAAVDGSQISFHAQSYAPYAEHTFINRHGTHSLNVLICCDAELRISAIDPRFLKTYNLNLKIYIYIYIIIYCYEL